MRGWTCDGGCACFYADGEERAAGEFQYWPVDHEGKPGPPRTAQVCRGCSPRWVWMFGMGPEPVEAEEVA